jgi:hypothetical protein
MHTKSYIHPNWLNLRSYNILKQLALFLPSHHTILQKHHLHQQLMVEMVLLQDRMMGRQEQRQLLQDII